ncbi:acyltransferase family protein [Serinicoccus sp. LYQ131]|uniref:acyltransferase family protein n=1 Tax=Serinicoccus sp. LYQ131 TaxID=3378797 RepID=UPI003854602F
MTDRGTTLRGDIEGLRAIAVLMVLLYHAQVPGLDGGFAGVDVFFVISGFLITRLLVKEALATGTVSIGSFYARRARRLLPAATVVLLFTTVAGYVSLGSARLAELGSDVLAAALYVVNWALAERSVDYLAEDSTASWVQHYWSLSVEEQFYVLWPLLILLGLWLARRVGLRPTRVLAALLAVVVVASFVWSVLRTESSPETAYFVTTTRIWELGIGAGLVFLLPRLRRLPGTASEALALVGLLAIVWSAFALSTATPWPGSAALVPTVGTALVIAAGSTDRLTMVARGLGVRPMRFVGALSYGLYLWHWPLLQLLQEVRPGSGLRARLAVAGLGVLLAWLTLRLVENPIRFHPGLARSSRRALAAGAGAMAVTVAAGGALWASAPRVGELPDEVRGALALTDGSSTPDPAMIEDPAQTFTRTGTVYPTPGAAVLDVPGAYDDGCQVVQEQTDLPDEPCEYGPADGTDVALLGDSKMLQWLPALLPIAEQEGWRLTVWTKSSCGFTSTGQSPECVEYNDALREHLADPEHTPEIILTSLGKRGEGAGVELADNLDPAVASGAEVVLVADNPYRDSEDETGDPSWYECVEDNPQDYAVCSFPEAPGYGTPLLERAHEELPGSHLVDLSRWICPPGTPVPGAEDSEPRCPSVIDEVLIFRQGSHLTATYVRTLTPLLHEALIGTGLATSDPDEVPWEIPPVDSQTASRGR